MLAKAVTTAQLGDDDTRRLVDEHLGEAARYDREVHSEHTFVHDPLALVEDLERNHLRERLEERCWQVWAQLGGMELEKE